MTIQDMYDHRNGSLTPAETCAALGISRSTLGRYVESGMLTPSRLPSGHRRFSAVQVAAILARKPWDAA